LSQEPVEVKKRGKVVILRLKRKVYEPERKPSVKRALRKLRTFFPCRAEEITANRLEDLIIATFGSEYQYHVLISDERFRAITKQQMEQLLKEDDTDTLPYISPEVFDCDDFGDVLLGSLTRKTLPQGFCIGQIWWYCPEFGHAQNLFCDGETIFVVEPQNDEITTWREIKGKWPNAKAFTVKF